MRANRYKRVFSFLILYWTLLFAPIADAYAQSAVPNPTFTARMSQAINGIITGRLKRMGFAANDPRYAATINGVSDGLTVLSIGAMATGASVSWPVILTAAGIAGLTSTGVSLLKSEGYEFTFKFNAQGQLTLLQKSPGGQRFTPTDMTIGGEPLVRGGKAYYGQASEWQNGVKVETGRIWANDPRVVAVMMQGMGVVQGTKCNDPTGFGTLSCYVRFGDGSTSFNGFIVNTGICTSCPITPLVGGIYDERTPMPPQALPDQTYANAKSASVAPIRSEMAPRPISNESLAQTANAAWKAAVSANTSGGIPWSAVDPITPEEAATWASANPASVPTVSDWVSSSANAASGNPRVDINPGTGFGLGGGGSSSPGGGGVSPNPTSPSNPAPSPEPSSPVTPVTPGKGEEVDWGPNPNIGAPGLEATPTASSILDPIFNLMPSLKSFAVPAHQAECPTAAFTVYGRDFLVNQHCGLLDQNRSVIAAAMMLVFSLSSLFIVLRA